MQSEHSMKLIVLNALYLQCITDTWNYFLESSKNYENQRDYVLLQFESLTASSLRIYN